MIREDIQIMQPKTVEAATPVTLSPLAATKLAEVMAGKGIEGGGIRVFVSGGGCSGLQYGMAFETEGGEAEDVVFEAQGLSVYVDPISIQYLQGTNIDYVDSLMGGGFKIENPNAASSCGCGSSFKPAGQEASAQSAPAAEGSCGSSASSGGGCGCG
jgi:iron-sulfur cluster assembly protein